MSKKLSSLFCWKVLSANPISVEGYTTKTTTTTTTSSMSSAPVTTQHPPLLQVTPTDHSAWIAVATVLGLCCALVTLLIRAFVRIVISPPLGYDDAAILAATVSYPQSYSVRCCAPAEGNEDYCDDTIVCGAARRL